jgi:hypothetical protein
MHPRRRGYARCPLPHAKITNEPPSPCSWFTKRSTRKVLLGIARLSHYGKEKLHRLQFMERLLTSRRIPAQSPLRARRGARLQPWP